MTTQPTGTVTFLFTDIEGSTRLWESAPDKMERVVTRHDSILNEQISVAGGYVFTTAGDAFSAAFTDPRDAITAAIDAQRALDAEEWEAGDILVRMSIHAGVAHERDGDYFGPTLNRAARILSAGHGGQVLVSTSTHDLIARRLPDQVALKDLGLHRLKDLGTPEHLYQLVHPDLTPDFAALKTLDAHLNNLPAELSSFVGRIDELNETVKRLSDSRLVTLTGVGGSGKTRLALQSAAELFDGFPGGVWIVELAGLTEPERLPHWVAEEIGISRSTVGTGLNTTAEERSWIEIIVDYLEPRTALLVLDNCEHLITPAAEFADLVLRSCPDLKILTTSREGLGIRGEYLIQVPSLALRSMFDDDTPSSGYPDAMELFAERAAAANSRFELNAESAGVVAEVCRRLDGMPLAIELAAARTRMLTVEQIAERLDDSFRLLTGGSRTALPRQQTLLATVEWSYDLLSEAERALFDRLAVFRGGFSLEAAEAVVSGEGVDEIDVFEHVASLVDKSMVQGGADSGRFRLLETLRQYALGKLTDAGLGDTWRMRHADYFAQFADDAFGGTRGSAQAQWMDRLEDDHDNIRAALTWCLEADHPDVAARISAGVWWFWQVHGHYKQALEYVELLRPHLDAFAPDIQVKLLAGAATIAGFDGDLQGQKDAERAVEIARSTHSPELEGPALLSLALAHFHAGRHDNALDMFRSAHQAFESAGDEWGMGWTTMFPAWVYRTQADVEAAEHWIEVCRGHFRKAGTQLGPAWALTTQGIMTRYRYEYEESIRLHEEALVLFDVLGDRNGVSFSHTVIALSLDMLGRYDEASDRAALGYAIEEDLGKHSAESASVASAIRRHAGAMNEGFALLARIRPLLHGSTTSDMCVVAEEVADYATAVGLFEAAAELVAYAAAERIRVSRPVPGPFQPERDRTTDLIAANVTEVDEITAAWRHRAMNDAIPLILATLDEIEAALASSSST